MAVALKRAGIHDFVITEEGEDVGGVWRENTYPGCTCDVPSHLYSFSFAPYRNRRWRYPAQTEILDYLRQVAHDHDLYRHLRTRTAVTAATYLEESGRWELGTGTGDRLIADAVVFATGQLHRPHIPEFPGHDRFTGESFHTARWNHHLDLHDREIAVIGTGSSAAQLLPHLAAAARHVRVYQRTPHWVLPKPSRRFGPLGRAALRLPGAHALYRSALYHSADQLLVPVARRGWSARPAEWVARAYLHRSVPDPRLRAAVTPHYPIGAKRILFDSDYYRTLARPDVDLITTPIAGLTATGIETVDGVSHRADIIVYATGFRAGDFLAPMVVRGREDRLLSAEWADGADAFFGVAIPGYPNAFLIAGPNTFNPAGSNPGMKECQIDYIMQCLRWRDDIGATAIDVRPKAAEHYRQWLQSALTHTVWPADDTPTWYKHRSGRVTNPWPTTARAFARMLKHHPSEAFAPVAPPTHHRRTGSCDCVGTTPPVAVPLSADPSRVR
jgi:cation diffusion facilitator CzcD-associated flavoprotein CzcO